MKLRQIIYEDKEESFWKANFKNFKTMTKTPDGWNFEPDISSQEDKNITELPYKINKVENECDLMGIQLENFNNMPNECHSLLLNYNNISSVATSHLIKTDILSLVDNPLVNLQGLQTTDLFELSLKECSKLQTLDGLQNIKVKNLILTDCPSFEDDLFKYKDNIETVEIDPTDSPNMPLVFMILYGKPQINVNIIKSTALKKIIQKYYEKGPTEAFDLIRELRDNGFKKAARTTK
jgi:hypothetical protein